MAALGGGALKSGGTLLLEDTGGWPKGARAATGGLYLFCVGEKSAIVADMVYNITVAKLLSLGITCDVRGAAAIRA
jgi:hypothetical protein